MKILSSVMEMASKAGCGCASMAIDLLLPAAQKAVSLAGLQATDIDLIVTLSLSPDRIAIDPSILGPRIGHPLQKLLQANNAYVFDLMDASVAKALHVTDIFAKEQGYKRVLFARTEFNAGLRADVGSKFSMADGAMACVIEPDGLSRFASVPVPGLNPMVIELNENIRALSEHKAFIRFHPNIGAANSFRVAASQAAFSLDPSQKEYLAEDWFTTEMGRKRETSATTGPFDLGMGFSSLTSKKHGSHLIAVSFDPFGPSAEAVDVFCGSLT
ncbi:MAG: hypothetical protein KF751_01275 [Nitrospira sp.]|nr:hypothetical protein [Nitrospira sp.]